MDNNQIMSNVQLLKNAAEVMAVCPHVTLEAIVKDLRLTNDSSVTITRILDCPALEASPSAIHTLVQPASRVRPPDDVIVLLSSSEDEDKVVKEEKLQGASSQHSRPERRSTSVPSQESRSRQEKQRTLDPFEEDDDSLDKPYVPSAIPPPLDIEALMREASSSPGRKESQRRTSLQRTTTYRNLHDSPSPLAARRGLPSATLVSPQVSHGKSVEASTLTAVDEDDDPFADWDFDLHVSPVSYKDIKPEIGNRPIVILSPKGTTPGKGFLDYSAPTKTVTTSTPSAAPSSSLRRGATGTTLPANNYNTTSISRMSEVGTSKSAPLSRKLFHDMDSEASNEASGTARVGSRKSFPSLKRDAFDDDDDAIELWNEDENDNDSFYSRTTSRKSPDKAITSSDMTTGVGTTNSNKRKRGRPSKQDTITQAEPFDLESLREWEDVSPALGRHTKNSSKMASRGKSDIIDLDLDEEDEDDDELESGLSLEELIVRHAQERREGRKTSQPRTRRSTRARKTVSATGDTAAGSAQDEDDEDDESGSDYGTKSTKGDASARAALKAQKEREKAERKARREEERERKRLLQQEQRERREQERMAREAEREAERKAVRDMRIANRLSTKSESAKEMIVCIERELFHSKFGKILQDYLRPLECQVETLKEQSVMQSSWRAGDEISSAFRSGTCSLKDMMYWKRAVSQRFDEAQDQFIPTERTEIEMEPFILLYFKAADFAQQLKSNVLGLNLETARREIRRLCNMSLLSMSNPTANLGDLAAKRDRIRVLYLIQGMDAYIRGLRRVITKNFQAAVLAKIQPNEAADESSFALLGSAMTSSSAEASAEQEQIESELLRLQIEERCLIIHVVDDEEASQVIVALTEQIGYAPYKPRVETNVCMEGIRSGQNAADTWIRALQGISMVTPQMAKSIAEEYPTMRMLYEGYRNCRTVTEAEEMLVNVQIAGKKRGIGRVISKRIYDVFMSQDPNKIV
ncbi:hypothetical protein BGW42_005851 [Actinomortierella wolfii]|nr:hypothetical protein BGW42_005851 [Actinomortierella wolfii]